MKLKTCTSKDTIKKVKRQPMWEKVSKISVNLISDKGLVSRHITQFKKWAKDLNRHFSKEDMQIAIKHIKKCLISLVIKEMQVKSTLRYHFTLIR